MLALLVWQKGMSCALKCVASPNVVMSSSPELSQTNQGLRMLREADRVYTEFTFYFEALSQPEITKTYILWHVFSTSNAVSALLELQLQPK